jgi:hypothetical protein
MVIETDFGAETTTDSDYANVRYFFKVELWTKDDQRVERLLHAGNRIDAARAVQTVYGKTPRNSLAHNSRKSGVSESRFAVCKKSCFYVQHGLHYSRLRREISHETRRALSPGLDG